MFSPAWVVAADFSQFVRKLFYGNACLTKDALQSFGENGFVVRHGEAHRALAHPNVRALLPHNLKPQPSQCPDGFTAGNIARQLHAVATTASLTKCNRIRPGSFPFPK